ncbi:MAG: hypothetical protein AAGB34_11435, partial [Planctomycetota bacterium]
MTTMRPLNCLRSVALMSALSLMPATSVLAQHEDQEKAPKVEFNELVDRFADSCVRVEYYFRYDGPDQPLYGDSNWSAEEYVTNETPMRTGGYLLAPDIVVVEDPHIAERFLDK